MILVGGDALRGRGPGVLRVIELRSDRLAAGRTRDFLRYFEEHFLFSQRDHGMHVLGQFEVVDAPDRCVWIRGFEDMGARLRGLTAFYGGAFWQARRGEASAMVRASGDVHLLRPVGLSAGLVGALTLEDRAAEPPGTPSPDGGLVTIDFYRAAPGALGRLLGAFEDRRRPALIARGHRVLGHFVAERAPNDYPGLPVIQDPDLLVVLSAYRDAGHHAALRADWSDDPWPAALPGVATPLGSPPTTLCLRPTARSLIRYHGASPASPLPGPMSRPPRRVSRAPARGRSGPRVAAARA